ncbi:MAG TPA: amino acid-binding protein, partial [Megasphaera sp.]|nr:amino acid-binding protein [Megasphaera sp.]
MLKQISLFTANTNGALGRVTDVLAKANINIYTILANDSAEFGILRMIVDDSEKAQEELVKAGYQCRIDKVLAIDMASDKPGTLNRILSDLRNANVMIRYLYISFDR